MCSRRFDQLYFALHLESDLKTMHQEICAFKKATMATTME